jgi:polyferredoxin
MLSGKESEFVAYWEKVREHRSLPSVRLIKGLPFALLFFLPIPLMLLAVNIWLPDWYTRISNRISGSFPVIMIAVFAGSMCWGYFRMQFRWEANEQYYRQLKAKEKQEPNPFTNS